MEAFHHAQRGGGHKVQPLCFIVLRPPQKKKKSGRISFLSQGQSSWVRLFICGCRDGECEHLMTELGGSCLVSSPRGLSSRLTHAAAMLTERVTGKVGESVEG